MDERAGAQRRDRRRLRVGALEARQRIRTVKLDLISLLGMSVVTAILARTERRVGRRVEGLVLLVAYAVFLLSAVLA